MALEKGSKGGRGSRARRIRGCKKAEEQVKKRYAYEKSLAEISNETFKSEDLGSFINFSLKSLGKLTNASRTYLFKIHDEGKKTSNTHEWAARGATPKIDNLQNVDCSLAPFWMKKLRKNKVINFSSVKDMPFPEREILEEQGIKSILVVPMYGQSGLYGFLGFDECAQHRKWEAHDVKLLRTASQIIMRTIERREAEEKLTLFSDALKGAYDAILITDLEGKVTYANTAVTRVYGYRPGELIGKSVSVLDKDVGKKDEILVEVSKHGGWTGEFVAVRKNGEEFLASLTTSLIKDGHGRPFAIMGASRDVSKIRELEREKKILAEKVTRLSEKIPLTGKEKLCFYALVQWPELNDRQLGKKTRLKVSTVTAIRNKLKREQYYCRINAPSLVALGCGMLTCCYGAPSLEIPRPELDKIPELVFGVGDKNESLFIFASRNLAEFTRAWHRFSRAFGDQGFNEGEKLVHFPFEISTVLNKASFAPLLKHLFGLSLEFKQPKEAAAVKRKLTKKEKTVLYGSIKYPELNDSRLGKKIKVQRSTVSRIKKQLRKEGILKPVNVPNIEKVGCELLVASRVKLRPDAPKKTKEDLPCARSPQTIFSIAKDFEIFNICIFKDFLEYKDKLDEIMPLLKEKNCLLDEPSVSSISLQEATFFKIDFGQLAKKALGFKN